MTLHHRSGDLLALARAGHFDVIVHGCNCLCAFGRGLAQQIKVQFPEAFAADCATKKADRNKLGTTTEATIAGPPSFVIVNAYTQFGPSGKGVVADYEAIGRALACVKQKHGGKRIGLPKIGAGLAGGDWPTIEAIIARELAGEQVTIVTFG